MYESSVGNKKTVRNNEVSKVFLRELRAALTNVSVVNVV